MSASARTRRVRSSAAAMPANPNAMLGRLRSGQAKHDAGGGPPALFLRDQAPRHRQQCGRRQQPIERGLQDQRFVEREEAGERRDAGSDPRRALAKPVAGREKDEPDRCGPEQHLEHPHRGERVSNGKAGGQEIDVERRDEVESRAERQVPGDDPPGELGVGGRVEADIGLEERVVPQLQHDQELEDEYPRQAQDGPSPPGRRHFRQATRAGPLRAGSAHPTFLSFRPTFLSSDRTLMFLDP